MQDKGRTIFIKTTVWAVYPKYGFQPIGVCPNYWIFMKKNLHSNLLRQFLFLWDYIKKRFNTPIQMFKIVY